jgi:hypothetical protein
LKFVYNTLNVFLETTLRFSPTFLKVTVSKLIYMCTCNIYDRIRSAFGLKSASTPKISIHWNHNLKSLRVSVWHRSWEIIWHCCQNDRLFQNKWPKRPTHATYASDMWSSILQFVHNIFWLKLMWNARSKLFYFIIYRSSMLWWSSRTLTKLKSQSQILIMIFGIDNQTGFQRSPSLSKKS